MRVTNRQTAEIITKNLFRNHQLLLESQIRVSTGKRINKPSDDPIGMGRVLEYRTTIERIEQFEDNIAQGKTRIEFNELTLDMVEDLISNVIGVAQENVAEGISAEQRQLAANEIKEYYDQIMQMANTKFDGRYIFSGHQTDTAPFSRQPDYTPDLYQGDTGSYRTVIGENVEVSIDADGQNYFQSGVDIFAQLKSLIDGLENPDLLAGSAAIDATLDPLFAGRQQINDKRTEQGTKIYRMEVTEEHWNHFKSKIEEAKADTEGADITEAIMQLKSLEIAYESTMATAARIIQPSLVNFLK